jgi:signal peptidase I
MSTARRSRLAPVLRATPRHVKELALTVGAIGGLACITLAISALVFGLQPLVVQSGSMEPTVAAGSLLITEKTPASELRRGDVVTVPRQDRALVTHRITEITLRGDTATLRLKGDANDVVDPQAYVVKEAGKKVFVVPYAGWVAAWAASGLGLFLLGLYVAFLAFAVAVDWRDRPWRRDAGRGRGRPEVDGKPVRGGKRKAVRRGLSAAGMAAITLGAMTAPLATPLPTLGAWTDDATAGTSTVSAYTVPKPVWVSCTVTGVLAKTVTVVWQEVSSPYALDYSASVDGGGSLTVTDNGTTRQVAVTSGLLGIGTFTIRVTARLPAPNGSWVSTALTQEITFVTSLIASCGSHN